MTDYTTIFRLYIVTTILERPADLSGGYWVLGGKEVGLLTSQHQLLNRGRLKLMSRSQHVH